MTDKNSYRASLQRRSVSETDTDPLSSTIYPTGNIYYAPPDRAESNPNLSISGFIDESHFAGPGTRLQSRREGIESKTSKISARLENLRFKICTWVDKMKSLDCPNEEFQHQFTTFSNAINELTTLALMNRVPMPMSRDITELSSIILRCKHDRLRNLDPWNDRPAPRTEINMSTVVPLTDRGFDSSISRGNLRSSSFYNSADHLHTGGIFQEFLCLCEEA